MKKGIVILLLFALQIFPVAASEQENGNQVYVPETSEAGGTIYGTVSGKALGDQGTPGEEDEEQAPNGSNKGTNTGTNTGDSSIFLFWIVLFIGSYIVLRKYVNGIEHKEE